MGRPKKIIESSAGEEEKPEKERNLFSRLLLLLVLWSGVSIMALTTTVASLRICGPKQLLTAYLHVRIVSQITTSTSTLLLWGKESAVARFFVPLCPTTTEISKLGPPRETTRTATASFDLFDPQYVEQQYK